MCSTSKLPVACCCNGMVLMRWGEGMPPFPSHSASPRRTVSQWQKDTQPCMRERILHTCVCATLCRRWENTSKACSVGMFCTHFDSGYLVLFRVRQTCKMWKVTVSRSIRRQNLCGDTEVRPCG